MYDCQGNFVCKEAYMNYNPLHEEFNPVQNLISPAFSPSFSPAVMGPRMSPAAQLAPTPQVTGLPGKCGSRNNRQKCGPGLFCLNDDCMKPSDVYSQLNSVTGQTKADCNEYSGRGIMNCDIGIGKNATANKCGWQSDGNLLRCDAGMFCSATGECISTKPPSSSDYCMQYSGEGVKSCSLPTTTPAPVYVAVTPAPAFKLPNFQKNLVLDKVRPKKQGAIVPKPEYKSVYACDDACYNDNTCKAFSFSDSSGCKHSTAVRADYLTNVSIGATHRYKN